MIILDPSKLKEFADNSFKFDEDSGNVAKRVEMLWEKEELLGKGEISRYKLFLLVPTVFSRTCTADT